MLEARSVPPPRPPSPAPRPQPASGRPPSGCPLGLAAEWRRTSRAELRRKASAQRGPGRARPETAWATHRSHSARRSVGLCVSDSTSVAVAEQGEREDGATCARREGRGLTGHAPRCPAARGRRVAALTLPCTPIRERECVNKSQLFVG